MRFQSKYGPIDDRCIRLSREGGIPPATASESGLGKDKRRQAGNGMCSEGFPGHFNKGYLISTLEESWNTITHTKKGNWSLWVSTFFGPSRFCRVCFAFSFLSRWYHNLRPLPYAFGSITYPPFLNSDKELIIDDVELFIQIFFFSIETFWIYLPEAARGEWIIEYIEWRC
jgi:hypothetical protein